MSYPQIFIAIDEHGRVLQNEVRVEDQDLLQHFFNSLFIHESGATLSEFGNEACYAEAFDAPWVITDLELQESTLKLINTYGFSIRAKLETCYFDEWDRLRGTDGKNVPWVLTRSAQENFFNLLDEYDDESFTLKGIRYPNGPAFFSDEKIQKPNWWTQVYQDEGKPGWDLQIPHPAFVDTLPRMKQPRSRVMVLGSGEGHDAAYFAQMGHVVTAVDFSEEAIDRAKKHYGKLPIEFLQSSAFELPKNFDKNVDILVEHTFFCAIEPENRQKLVQTWNRLIIQGGYLMGVFFVNEKRSGPPFGASEWEIRERLKKDYHILFWGRWRQSPGRRQGKELFVLAQKK